MLKTCKHLAATGLPAALCTIYQPPVDDPVLRQLGTAALHRANTAIEAEAQSWGLDVIDLREACREAADFSDPIRPSGAEPTRSPLFLRDGYNYKSSELLHNDGLSPKYEPKWRR
jgi:hypothetical protein